MFEVLYLVVVLILLLFGFVLLFGAPYLPILKPQLNAALELMDLKKDDHLLELGCGDGRVLVAAAKQGYIVTGYELNPILAFIAWVRTRKYKNQVKVVCGNFWNGTLPKADGIFVFLLPKYMKRLDTKITQEFRNPVKLVSFAFKIPDRKIAVEKDGVFLYLYN